MLLRGFALRVVINQPEAVSFIAMPISEAVLAAHKTLNSEWPNAPHRDGVNSAAASGGSGSAFKVIGAPFAGWRSAWR